MNSNTSPINDGLLASHQSIALQKLPNNLLYTTVRINNCPLNFIIDTGASVTCMHNVSAQALKLVISAVNTNERAAGLAETTNEKANGLLSSLQLGHCMLQNYDTAVINLSGIKKALAPFTPPYTKIEGIIGADFLLETQAILDYQTQQIHLPIVSNMPTSNAATLYEPIAWNCIETQHLLLDVLLNGRQACLILDTGASHTCLDTETANELAITITYTIEKVAGLGSSNMEKQTANATDFMLGNWHTSNQDITILDLSNVVHTIYENDGIQIAGVIGADILQTYCALICYDTLQLYLKKHDKI